MKTSVEEFRQQYNELTDEAAEIMWPKMADYAIETDALHNFRTTAEFLGVPMRQVAGTFLYKHFTSVMRYCREGTLDSEGLESRLADLINYCAFIKAIANEEDY